VVAVDIQELLRHRPFVRALARSLVKDDARADDLVQQTWLTAIEKPPRHARSLRAWLGAVVRNLARTQNRAEWRRARHEGRQEPGRTLPTPAETLEKAAWHQRLVEAVMELEEPYRTTLLLRYFEDLDSKEIGAAQGIPPATVRTRLRRGLARLREKLDAATEGGRGAWVPALVLLARPSTPAPAIPAKPAPATPGWLLPAATLATLLVGVYAIGRLIAMVGDPSGTNGGRSETARTAPIDPGAPATPVTLPQPSVGHRLGVLVLVDGRPAGGVAVALARTDEHPWRDVPTGPWRTDRRAVTQGDGRAWFAELPAGYLQIAAWRPGCARATAHVHLPQPLEYEVVLELAPEAPVDLEIVDAERGTPIPNAAVFCAHDPAPDAFRSDARGVVRLHGIAPGEPVAVRIDAAGYGARSVPARAARVELEPADRTVRWPLIPPAPPEGTAIELRRDGAAAQAVVEGGFLVARALPRGAWPEHEAWAPGPRVARVEAERGVEEGAPIRFEEPRALRVTLVDPDPVAGLPLRLEDPGTGEPISAERTDGRFLRVDDRRVRLAYRERGASRWRPLRDVTSGDVTVRLPAPVRIRMTGRIPERVAVYVDQERYVPWRDRDGSLELELRPRPDHARVRVDLLAHGFVATHREFDLARPGAVDWPVELQPGSRLAMRVRDSSGELVLADPATGEPRWRGPWWFRLEAGPDGVVRDAMVPPGRHVVRDLVRGVSSEPFDAPDALPLLFDVEAAAPWVEGRVVAHVGLDRAATRLEAFPGGPIDVRADGGFGFPWPGPCDLVAHLADLPAVRTAIREPRADVELQLSPVAVLRLRPDRPGTRGRVVARDPQGGVVSIEASDALRFAGFAPGRYDLWIDLDGCVPQERSDVLLAEGETALDLECDPGATLRVIVPGEVPVSASVQSLDAPRYRRTGATEVTGLGAGRFQVTVWNRFTGLLLHSGEIVSGGHGEIPLVIDLR